LGIQAFDEAIAELDTLGEEILKGQHSYHAIASG
jgi:hypothetical protein